MLQKKMGRAGLLAALVHRAPNRLAELLEDVPFPWVEVLLWRVLLATLEQALRTLQSAGRGGLDCSGDDTGA